VPVKCKVDGRLDPDRTPRPLWSYRIFPAFKSNVPAVSSRQNPVIRGNDILHV